MRRLTPMHIALIVGAVILLGIALLFVVGRNTGDQDKLGDNQTAATTPSAGQRCASSSTYDAIKREIFRQASEMRGSDKAAFDKLAAYAAVRMDSPVLKSRDESVGTVSCSGRLSLDLPPGVAVVGGRRTLTANLDYVIQSAADNSGEVVALDGADAIVVPLATLARAGSEQPPAAEPLAPDAPPAAEPATLSPPPAPRPEPQVRPQAGANPSFNCNFARSRGEIAVCNNPRLATLDRDMAAQYYRAVDTADVGQRELLRSTRSRFLGFRDNCRTDACIEDAYRGRITEIGDILANRWRSRR